MRTRLLLVGLVLFLFAAGALAEVGDPQIRTNHPWYPGELACSTFERLRTTQAELYERVVGRKPTTDEDRALASWYWRNLHFWHGEPGNEDCFAKGFKNGDSNVREYWSGLFGYGFALCGTTHAQWIGEMEALLGHNRARCVSVPGHTSFEVWLTGGKYGDGKWVLLDHDTSTVIFDEQGQALLAIADIQKNPKAFTSWKRTAQQHGWLPSGLHQDDGSVYSAFQVAQYLAGYAGPPPSVHLRRGETFRRYFEPGLDDGKTFVFWGRNYKTQGIPGPERSRTWVNQPEKMYQAKQGTPHKDGQARFANAVFTYEPNFATDDYREGLVQEAGDQVILEFASPYVIGATPANDQPWGVYEPGGKNGLIVRGQGIQVSVSIDHGRTWTDPVALAGAVDLTDAVKGGHQYYLKLLGTRAQLQKSQLSIRTVCQANSSVLPRLTDGGSRIEFAASGRAVTSAGPNAAVAQTHVVDGKFDSPKVTLQLMPPRPAKIVGVSAAAHVRSSSPPSPDIKYNIEYSLNEGQSWQPLVTDWQITRRGNEPKDFWSQSFCWGEKAVSTIGPVRVRFANTGGKQYARAEMHLTYDVLENDATQVTYHWQDDSGPHDAKHTFAATAPAPWQLPTGQNVQTKWVEFTAVAK